MTDEGVSVPGTTGDVPDIEARTFEFALRIVRLCVVLTESPGVRRTLGSQLLRSGTSVGANVTEAQAAQSKPDFISKMNIALKEARESHYWLRLLASSNLLAEGALTALKQEADEIARILGAIVRSARRNVDAS